MGRSSPPGPPGFEAFRSRPDRLPLASGPATVGHYGERPLSQSISFPLVIAGLVAVYWPTARALFEEWTERGAYDHGVVVIVGAVWFTARRVVKGESLGAQWAPPVLVAVLMLAAAWSLAFLANVSALEQTLWPVIAMLTLIALGGFAIGRQLALPFALVMLAMPVWDYAIPVLQRIAVLGSSTAVFVAGIPAAIGGNLIHIPAGSFEIEGGCSGLRYVLAAVTLAVLMGEVVAAGVPGRWALVGIGVAAAVAANWIRILIVIAVGHSAGMNHSIVQDHQWVGWATFAVLVVPSMVAASRWVGAGQALGQQRLWSIPTLPRLPAVQWAWVAVAAAALPLAARFVEATRYRGAEITAALPAARGEWLGPVDATCPWRAERRGGDLELCGIYESTGSTPVFVSIVAYLRQRNGHELIGGNGGEPEGGWTVSARGVVETTLPAPATVAAQTIVPPGGPPWRMWYWYGADSLMTHSALRMKIAEAMAWSPSLPASLTVIASPCRGDCAAADAVLQAYLDAHADLPDSVKLTRGRAVRPSDRS